MFVRVHTEWIKFWLFLSSIERRNRHYHAWWFGTERKKLGDEPYGHSEGGFKELVRKNRYRKGWWRALGPRVTAGEGMQTGTSWFWTPRRKESLLALWVSSLSRSPYWWGILLWDGNWRTVHLVVYLCGPFPTSCRSPVTNTDYPTLEKVFEAAIKEKQKFERLVVSKEKLLEMFNMHNFRCWETFPLNLL